MQKLIAVNDNDLPKYLTYTCHVFPASILAFNHDLSLKTFTRFAALNFLGGILYMFICCTKRLYY